MGWIPIKELARDIMWRERSLGHPVVSILKANYQKAPPQLQGDGRSKSCVQFVSTVQGSTNRWALGLVNFVPVLDYHFWLNLPAAFTQPGGPPISGALYVGIKSRKSHSSETIVKWTGFVTVFFFSKLCHPVIYAGLLNNHHGPCPGLPRLLPTSVMIETHNLIH